MSRCRRGFLVILAVFSFLSIAEQALAWGPATHVALGNSVLAQLALLPAGIAGLLARHALAYLYGNIAADIVFAKRMSRVKQFCHHWSTGFRLLSAAKNDDSKSFALGYLSHLAADTVAHGKYVPRQIVLSGCTVNFGHFYWELRADGMQPGPVWHLVRNVIEADHGHHHATLSEHLTDTLLSFETNRVLFERINALAVRRGFQRSVGLWGQFSRFDLCPELLGHYHSECVDRILSILTQGDRSPLLKEDPNGTSALVQVKVQRRAERWVPKDSLLLSRRRAEVSSAWSPRVTYTDSITDPLDSGPQPVLVDIGPNGAAV